MILNILLIAETIPQDGAETNTLTLNQQITIGIAVVALCASIAAFILSLINSSGQKRLNYADTFMNIVSEHRALYSTIYSNKQLYQAYIHEHKGKTPSDTMSTFFINHCNSLYYYRSKHLIEDKIWKSLEDDIKEIFMLNYVNHRWQTNKTSYPDKFQKYIDNLLKSTKPKTEDNTKIEHMDSIINPCPCRKCIRDINKKHK